MRTFIPFPDALETVLSHGQKTEQEIVALSDAIGRTLSGPIEAADDIPPFASSAMDGYAIRTADFQADPQRELIIAGHIAAGAVHLPEVKSGTCVEIMTGAPFPPGADAVAQKEWVRERTESTVSFSRVPDPGKHVRPAAEDVARGEQVFQGGERITPAILGMLAALGVDPVPVRYAPRVRIISSGDEIVEACEEPGEGQIRNSNGPSLRAQVLEAGGFCARHEHVPDTPDEIRQVIASDPDADILVFSGGVSVGDHDHIRQVLESMGGKTLFWKVKQRPGKPLAFGTLGTSVFIGLPGNPVSSAMCFEIYVRPLIEKMLGRSSARTSMLTAQLSRDIRKVQELHFFTRGIARVGGGGQIKVEDTGPQRSNLYGSVVRANCIIHLPAGLDRIEAGSEVMIQLLPWASLLPA